MCFCVCVCKFIHLYSSFIPWQTKLTYLIPYFFSTLVEWPLKLLMVAFSKNTFYLCFIINLTQLVSKTHLHYNYKYILYQYPSPFYGYFGQLCLKTTISFIILLYHKIITTKADNYDWSGSHVLWKGKGST